MYEKYSEFYSLYPPNGRWNKYKRGTTPKSLAVSVAESITSDAWPWKVTEKTIDSRTIQTVLPLTYIIKRILCFRLSCKHGFVVSFFSFYNYEFRETWRDRVSETPFPSRRQRCRNLNYERRNNFNIRIHRELFGIIIWSVGRVVGPRVGSFHVHSCRTVDKVASRP